MKTTQVIFYFLTIVFLSSCGGEKNPDVVAIKMQLDSLKKIQTSVNDQIANLESALKKAQGDSTGTSAKIKDVSVETIVPKTFNHYLEVQGKVDSDKNVLVSSTAAGTILSIKVNKGDFVKKGTVLASIDDDLIRKGMEELKTNIALTKTIYDKQKSLWDQKIGTELQYLQAKNNYETLVQKLDQLKEQQSAYHIKATIDGTVDEIFPKEGEITAPGAPTFRLINTSDFKVIAELGENYIDKIKKGNKAQLYFPDINYTMDTYVNVISDVISPINRTFRVEFAVSRIPQNMKANMLTYVKILDYSKPSSIVIPVNVVQHSGSGDFIYLVSQNKAVKRSVTVGNIYRTDAEILSGLAEGDKIITVGYQDMVDGQLVKF